ncbi:Zinc finger domain [Encephalitozoon cuniculi GB-M1]|uniref:Zinc finger C2H2 protein ECU10_0150 n=1 Tax=Encephalitozoon cuniculi (strain GB-M1) TaxID=284813 RepID=ZA15_ENCCU|nr:uncharacterized protein ECU10_0150 [Encephalitozoon cuniculi GB-M1]Q8SUH6.1 RecName: Full=Zinc finger C2H2 protein ECU10_0150 [Encephalitozoon cuniculi GB-M1]KMV65166.1 hypothetical protein M970_100020 [Encephalitozoon cuniculi EcunIII-L]UYI26471.1 hypothetical protein J0A71_02g02960 [Encephalitozoon cuniculi]CAD25734.1 Zinc finger domain [Encephalitozoon cuniculi GB-M1]
MDTKGSLADKIDIFFLLKQQKLITKKELGMLLPTQSYEDYRVNYYRRRVPEVFDRNFRKEWFIYRYLDDFFCEERRKAIWNIYSFKIEGPCIIARNISDDVPGSVINSAFSQCVNLERFWIQHQTSQNGFSRLCYIILKKEASVQESIDFMRSVLDRKLGIELEEFDISGVVEPKILSDCNDYDTAMSIFSSMCRMFDINEEEVLKKYSSALGDTSTRQNTAEFICNALKNVFLYCYTCAHQYDDPLEMMMGCRNHKTTDAAARRREFLSSHQEFGYLDVKTKEEELNNMTTIVNENHYKCGFCGKAFESEKFIFNHFNNKHENEIRRIEKGIENFKKFICRIDCFVLGIIEGTDDDRIPKFILPNIKDDRVVYDMGAVFSGEIAIGK